MVCSFASASLAFVKAHPGIVLVLIGVAGEIVLEWKKTQGKLAWLKKSFWILLILGLVLEFFEATKSDRDIAVLNRQAAELVHSNLVLSLELEKLKQPRIMNVEQKMAFMKSLHDAIKGPIRLGAKDASPDSVGFMDSIQDALTNAGYTIISRMDYREADFVPAPLPAGCDIWLIVNQSQMYPPPMFSKEIEKALKSVGIVPAWTYANSPMVNSNELLVFVPNKL